MIHPEEVLRLRECQKRWNAEVDREVLAAVKVGAVTVSQIQLRLATRPRQEITQSLTRLVRTGFLSQASKIFSREIEAPYSVTPTPQIASEI